MKKIVLLLFLFFFMTQKAYAHLPGQAPYFKINGKYSPLYPFPSKIQPGVELPQDVGPEIYATNQILHFEIDVKAFPNASPDQIKKTKFYWKFGDGAIAEGLSSDHGYAKQGDYLLKILADDGVNPKPQLFESVLIHVKQKEESKKPATWNIWHYSTVLFLVGVVLWFFSKRMY